MPYFEAGARLAGRNPIYFTDLIAAYRNLNRFADARSTVEKSFPEGVDAPNLRRELLLAAYAEGNASEAAQQVEWFAGKPEEYRRIIGW